MEQVTRTIRKGRMKNLTADKIDALVRQYNAGATQDALAKTYGVSRSTVQRYLRERRPNVIVRKLSEAEA